MDVNKLTWQPDASNLWDFDYYIVLRFVMISVIDIIAIHLIAAQHI